jgi:Na+-driven multidrug efflux pump
MVKGLLITDVFADTAISNAPIDGNVFGVGDFRGFIIMIINLLIIIGVGLVIVFLALGFIKFATSQGDKAATDQAKKWLTYTFIGGIGILAVFAIKEFVLTLIGAEDPLSNV